MMSKLSGMSYRFNFLHHFIMPVYDVGDLKTYHHTK